MKLSAKFVSMLCLSLILVNAGVAWALHHCSTDRDLGDHIRAQSESPATDGNSAYPPLAATIEQRHEALSRIHCPETPILKLAFGAASSGFRLESPKEDAANAVFLTNLLNTGTSTVSGSLLESARLLFERRLSPHLFLPRFRI